MSYTRHVSLTALVLAVSSSGCSSSSDGGTPADAGAADTAATVDSAPDASKVKDEGVMVNFDDSKPLAGVTVTEGDASMVTGADGKFSLVVPKGEGHTLSFSKDGFITENYPEGILSVDVDRGKIKIVPQATYDLVTGSFSGFNPTHGLLYIEVETESTCATATGSTLTLATPGVEVVRYVKGGIPSATQSSINQAEQPVVALFYNVPTDTQLDVVFGDTTCAQAPFPYAETSSGITYTGSVQVHGNASTIARYFLK
jgi:hypothetical protein